VTLQERVARAIYEAAFQPANEKEAKRQVPSPGWCWERTSPEMRAFAMKQAAAAIEVMSEQELSIDRAVSLGLLD
jgi:hypothetical protein